MCHVITDSQKSPTRNVNYIDNAKVEFTNSRHHKTLKDHLKLEAINGNKETIKRKLQLEGVAVCSYLV